MNHGRSRLRNSISWLMEAKSVQNTKKATFQGSFLNNCPAFLKGSTVHLKKTPHKALFQVLPISQEREIPVKM